MGVRGFPLPEPEWHGPREERTVLPLDHRVHIPEWARYLAGLWAGDVLEVRVIGAGEIALRWIPPSASEDPATSDRPRDPGRERER